MPSHGSACNACWRTSNTGPLLLPSPLPSSAEAAAAVAEASAAGAPADEGSACCVVVGSTVAGAAVMPDLLLLGCLSPALPAPTSALSSWCCMELSREDFLRPPLLPAPVLLTSSTTSPHTATAAAVDIVVLVPLLAPRGSASLRDTSRSGTASRPVPTSAAACTTQLAACL
eukprot:CAMPEP_0202395650 /NCGR_PEP_ID=MMETSP1127-20130417/94076_1 /ASSEMBLY_ACC=CAM_ASM_000462 /TAXON_ID=3047 /ORGANISM="Dunaliella tertiolecta, Strain CCMP1320" /LENGTH=171 /DNA_ID=CAMNT_0048998355 /DNA_START=2992 /DNA_END=3504 /DNA_ORIENTATION=+